MEENNEMSCPECGRTDAVLKLSVYYAESLLQGSDKTEIEKSSPPIKPKFNGLFERYITANQNIISQTEKNIGCLSALLVYFITLALPFILWFYIVVRITFAIFGAKFDMDASFPSDTLFAPVLFVMLIIPPVILIYFGWRKRRQFNKEHMPSWLASIEEWSKQFYCKSCDHFFIPESAVIAKPIKIDWKPFTIKKVEERKEFEKSLNPYFGHARDAHCAVCDKEIRGILFTSEEFDELTPAAYQKLKIEALMCPKCNAVYCRKCKNKALGFTIAHQFSQAICLKCKASIPTQDTIVEINGWYDSLLKSSDIEEIRKTEEG